MGMYTEVLVNVDFKEETPKEVIDTIKAICENDLYSELLIDKPSGWMYLFCNQSYYTPSTECANLTYDESTCCWSLLGKGDTQNREMEIEWLFEYIEPWVSDGLMGYSRREQDREPKLFYAGKTDD